MLKVSSSDEEEEDEQFEHLETGSESGSELAAECLTILTTT